MSNYTSIVDEDISQRVQLAGKVQEILSILDIAPSDRAYLSKMSDSIQVAEQLLSELKKEVHSLNRRISPVNCDIK